MTPTTGDDTTATHENQLDHDVIEDIIDVVQEDSGALEDQVDDAFAADVDNIQTRLELLEDAVDDAQDDEGENPLGPVPAQLDYLQRTVTVLEDQTDAAVMDDIGAGLEALEEEIEGADITKTKWYAQVDGIPEVYDQQTVQALRLKQQGDIEGNTEEYKLHALPTPTADIEDSLATFTEDHQEVDLEEFTFFRTEKQEGGVV